ncbi:MAG: hypothetical protein AAGC84_11345 [Pseudomonas sp.]
MLPLAGRGDTGAILPLRAAAMNAKQMRVLITDNDQHLRFTVEKLLNNVGCHGIAVVGSLDETMALLAFPGRRFDAVLINCQMLESASAASMEVLHNYGNVVLYRNGLYSGHMADPLALIREGICGVPGVLPALHQAS